ncbi:HNH endonuclease, partial [Aedoeadaptatus coxii]
MLFLSSQTEFLASGKTVPENCQMLCRDCNI